MWQLLHGRKGSGEKQKKKKKKKYSHQDALGTPTHPVSGPHNRKSCFHNAATAASARSAVPGRSVALCCALKPQRGLHTEAGVTHITGVLQDTDRFLLLLFFCSNTSDLLYYRKLFNNPLTCCSTVLRRASWCHVCNESENKLYHSTH